MFHTRYAARTLRDLNSLAISGWSIPGESVPQEIASGNQTWLANEHHPFLVNCHTQKTSPKKIGQIASHVWWHRKLYSIVVSHGFTQKKHIFVMYQLWHTKPHTNMTWLWLSIFWCHSYPQWFHPQPQRDWMIPTPSGRHGLRSWSASSGCIHHSSPLLFTIVHHYCSPLLFAIIIHHYIYTIIYIYH
jgi:hypothetical protein